MIGLLGKKRGMSSTFDKGRLTPVTVIEVGPCPIVQVKKSDGKDGYNAIKLGFWESEKISKPLKGIMVKIGKPGQKIMGEFLIEPLDDDRFVPGNLIGDPD